MMREMQMFSSTSSDFLLRLVKRLLQEKNLVFICTDFDEINVNLQKHVVKLNDHEHNGELLLNKDQEAHAAFFDYLENVEPRFREDGNFSLILTFTDTLKEHIELVREGGECATAWVLLVHDIRSNQDLYSYRHDETTPEIYMNLDNVYFIEISKSDKRNWDTIVQNNDEYDWSSDPLTEEMNAIISPLLGLNSPNT